MPLRHQQDIVVQVLVDHVPGFFVSVFNAAYAQSLALAQGIVHQAVVFADGFTIHGVNFTGLCRQVFFEKGIEAALADKADAGAVFLVMGDQIVFARQLADGRFLVLADGKQGMRELLLVERVQEIALILVAVDTAQQLCSAVISKPVADIVAGGDFVGAQ